MTTPQTTQHTPGPWTVYEQTALDYRPCIIMGDDGARVAICEGGGPKRAVTKAEERANARLIAAAPATAAERDRLRSINAELLAALKLMLVVHGQSAEAMPCYPETANREARAAIAKAEGRK